MTELKRKSSEQALINDFAIRYYTSTKNSDFFTFSISLSGYRMECRDLFRTEEDALDAGICVAMEHLGIKQLLDDMENVD